MLLWHKNLKRALFGCAVAVAVAIPSSLYINQTIINTQIQHQLEINQGQFKKDIQAQNEKYKQLEKANSEQQKELNTIKQKNKELQVKNQELEEVRSLIINSVGYAPRKREIALLEKLVEAEAGAEPYEGKVAVANVVFNRIKSKEFPNTITDVIYQKNQFEPVVTGMIYRMNPSSESKKAVKHALHGEKVINSDIVNFWADYLPASNTLWNHIPVEFKLGTQCFGKGWID